MGTAGEELAASAKDGFRLGKDRRANEERRAGCYAARRVKWAAEAVTSGNHLSVPAPRQFRPCVLIPGLIESLDTRGG